MEKKFLYVIGPSGGPLKIGISDDVYSRRCSLNIGNPKYLRIFIKEEMESGQTARKLEVELHYSFRDSHIRGEWFDLTESDLPAIRKAMHVGRLLDYVPDGWSLERKSCDEFTAEVCKISRLALELSVKQLADLSDLSEVTIKNFEEGESSPNMVTIEAMKEALESQGVEFVKEEAGERLRILI